MKTAFIWTSTGMREVARTRDSGQQYVRAELAEGRWELLTDPGVRNSDPDTARDAAKWMKKAQREECQKVYDVLKTGSRNSVEVARVLGRNVESLSTRFTELERAGFIRKTGERRPGHSGVRGSNVYEVIG